MERPAAEGSVEVTQQKARSREYRERGSAEPAALFDPIANDRSPRFAFEKEPALEILGPIPSSRRAGFDVASCDRLRASAELSHFTILPHQLIKHHARRGGHIQRMLCPQHRNPYMRVRDRR